jgi:hypothetical protein
VHASYALADVGEAFTAFEGRTHFGKILLRP